MEMSDYSNKYGFRYYQIIVSSRPRRGITVGFNGVLGGSGRHIFGSSLWKLLHLEA